MAWLVVVTVLGSRWRGCRVEGGPLLLADGGGGDGVAAVELVQAPPLLLVRYHQVPLARIPHQVGLKKMMRSKEL